MGETGEQRTPTVRPRRPDVASIVIAGAVVALLAVAGDGRAPAIDAAPPPPGGFSHGAAGSGRNGVGGSIAPSPTVRSWPGTGSNGNGGPFAFIGAHYGSMWQVPASANNSRGVGYCVMEDVGGEGVVSLQPDPPAWDAGEMARAAAVMSSFGGDRVVPYGIDASGPYDVASGEWQQPTLFGGGEYTRRRHVAVNFAVKMFLEDVSPTGAVAGLKLARDTAVVNGSGGDFSALRNGYVMAQRLAAVAEIQHAVGGVHLQMVWATVDGAAPTQPGTHHLEVRASDSTGKPVGFVPIVMLSDVGIDGARTVGATANVNRSSDSPDDAARWTAAAALGWPTMDMAASMATDPRFGLAANPSGAAITDASGIASFDVIVAGDDWQLAFHTQAPTSDVSLYAGTGIQGQVTWTGRPQSASVHVVVTPPPPPPPPPPAVGSFAVRKALDAADVQGDRDMSGFEFEVAAADGTAIGRFATGADGRTPTIGAVAGAYVITEVGRPAWAAGLSDAGPVAFDLAPGDGVDVREVTYTNRVPAASISTSARDARDGDRVIELVRGDAAIVDTVEYSALVPGTEYVVTGELMVRPGASTVGAETGASTTTATITVGATNGDTVASSTVAVPEMIPTGITASATFVPTEPDGSVDVTFTVPAGSPLLGHVVVVFQRLAVAASGRIVATHADPDATEQTLRFADVTPTTTVVTPSTTAAVEAPVTSPSTTNPPTTSSTTTSSTPASSTTTPVAMAAPPVLARTGSDSTHTTLLGAAALALVGAGLLVTSRRTP